MGRLQRHLPALVSILLLASVADAEREGSAAKEHPATPGGIPVRPVDKEEVTFQSTMRTTGSYA
jgi:hypothetical protein